MGTHHDPNVTATKSVRRPAWPVVLATVAALAAPLIYFPLIDNTVVRSTAWPTFLIAAIAAVSAVLYARLDERVWVRFLAGVNAALLLIFAGAFFWLAALPAPQTAANMLETAKDFTLKDARGRDVTLSDEYRSGPVLLVFYRGFW